MERVQETILPLQASVEIFCFTGIERVRGFIYRGWHFSLLPNLEAKS